MSITERLRPGEAEEMLRFHHDDGTGCCEVCGDDYPCYMAAMLTDLLATRAERDRLAAEMDQMRGVVTEAVVALATALVDDSQIGHAVRRAAQGESPNPRWHSDATEVYRSVSAVVSVLGVYGGSVALTSPTDGGA